MKLSDISCKQAKYDPNEKPDGSYHKRFDGGGLFLHIKPKGKYWRFKYRFQNKDILLSFGVYPEISLKEAREMRNEARKLLAKGLNPRAVKQEEKQQAILNLFSGHIPRPLGRLLLVSSSEFLQKRKI